MNKYISKTKFIYFLTALVIIIGCYALNLSYSLFVQTEETNIVDANVSELIVTLKQMDYVIKPNSSQVYILTVQNQSNVDANFSINATSSISENISIKSLNIDNNTSYGTINKNTSIEIFLEISNNNATEATINFTVDYNYSTITYDFDSYLSNTIIDNINKAESNFKTRIISKDLVTTSDGLYNQEENYIYKGNVTNNYFKFSTDSKMFRIVSLNSDNSIKLVENNETRNIAFDASNNRTFNIANSLVNSSYCTGADNTPAGETSDVKYGCNMFNTQSAITTLSATGNVANNSTIKQFLEGDYLNSLSETLRSKLLTHNFYNGFISETDSVSSVTEKNNSLSFESNVGLLSVKDVIDSDLTILPTDLINNHILSNYLVKLHLGAIRIWLLNGCDKNTWDVWSITNDAIAGFRASRTSQITNDVTIKYYAYPVIFVSDNVRATGSGTIDDPYIAHFVA